MECGKRTFLTKGEAIEAAKGILKARRKNKMNFKSYHCKDCGHFHLTSSEKTLKRKKRILTARAKHD